RHGGLQTLDASVRDCHAMTQPGRAETLAGEKAVGDQGARQAVQVLEQEAGFLESTLLAGGIDAHEDLSGGQDGRKTVHGSGITIMHLDRWTPRGQRPPKTKGAPGRLFAVGLHQTFWGFPMVILDAGLVLTHLTVELVYKLIQGGVEVFMRTLG